MSAVEQFAAKVTIPVLYDHPKALDQIGTGTLFEIDHRIFLVTAAHLFKDADPSNFSIPNPLTTKLTTLGPYNIFRAKEENVDIAVLELLQESVIAHAKAGWCVLTLNNTGHASQDGLFALSGYPGERAKREGERIGGSLLTTYSNRILEIPEGARPPVHPRLDLFFYYDLEVTKSNGATIKAPHLGGTSGAPIWEYREPAKTWVWTPEQCLKFVGVQSAFLEGRYFRAKSWAAVLEILRQADESLAAIVATHEAGNAI